MDEQKLKEFMDNLIIHQVKIGENFKFKPNMEHMPVDLGIAHMMVLKVLSVREKPPIIADLAKELSISASMMTHIIDKIESAKLIHRTRDESDRRIVRVEITEEGKNLVNKLDAEARERIVLFLKNLNENDQNEFINAMNVLITITNKYKI